VDADGLMSVAAEEQISGVRSEITVKPSYGLRDQDIEGMLRDALEHAGEDVDARTLREQQVEADRVVNALRAALQVDGHKLLHRDEFERINDKLDALLKVMHGQNVQAIKKAIDHLDTVTREYAARRMDGAIRKAMTGHKVSDFQETTPS